MIEKRQRNSRRSKYRPRSEAQKQRRRELWEARAQDRQLTSRLSEEDALKVRLDELESALRDVGRGGVHSRRNTIPLEQIEDDEQRFRVLKARVDDMAQSASADDPEDELVSSEIDTDYADLDVSWRATG